MKLKNILSESNYADQYLVVDFNDAEIARVNSLQSAIAAFKNVYPHFKDDDVLPFITKIQSISTNESINTTEKDSKLRSLQDILQEIRNLPSYNQNITDTKRNSTLPSWTKPWIKKS